MNYVFSNTYTIIQNGKQLSSPDKIKINKISNKTERFVFEFDGSIPSYLFVSVLFTHQTKGYQFCEPILYDGLNKEYYYIIGTSLSKYPGLWSLTLVGTEQDFHEEGYNNIDESMFFYSSNPFKKITVLDTDVDAELTQLSYPNIDKQMYDFHSLHNNIVELSLEVAQLHGECEQILEQNQEINDNVIELENTCRDLVAQCTTIYTNVLAEQSRINALYTTLSNKLRNEFEQYKEELERG